VVLRGEMVVVKEKKCEESLLYSYYLNFNYIISQYL